MRWIALALTAVIIGLLIYAVYPYLLPPEESDIFASQICIENQSGQNFFVTAEADAGAEVRGLLNDKDQLCASSPVANDTGKVRVFESEEAVEGCSRLARAGTTERLLDYSSFDNCEWDEG
ncbi:hypothetical protein [Pararhizobium sp. IMCC21322]|uniref:hypothetical protein n=1 Tax=Pararhizobium sp. IMCC21322 TaxID=3067903 RepID=UPI0027427DDF|nr:hypothetical protein [Pararhizobium sp. IMCC21322]